MANTNNHKRLAMLPIEEGVQARDANQSLCSNPYNRDGMPLSHVAWAEGWYEADRAISLEGIESCQSKTK